MVLVTPEPLVSCIDFEDVDSLSTKGMNVVNNGVVIVENGVNGVAPDFCPQGNRCGYFNGGKLEIPYFANNYGHTKLRITMDFRRTDTTTSTFMVVFNIYI